MNTPMIHPIKLEKGQYLNDIEPFKSSGIPSNCILHKTVTGCGITTSEIRFAKRNTIIILPNVPVIEGKVKAHNDICGESEKILGVYKGIEIDAIEDYLASSATYKKILMTPEGFSTKLVEIFKENIDDLLNGYFMLFDECDRIVKDIGYREMIAAPINWFFRFKCKALVSATVLEFSDKRFGDFEHYIIEPQYDYSRPIKLLETNNVLQSLKNHLHTIKGEHVSIFLNSTDTILLIIQSLKIEEESRVFCAPESVTKLKVEGPYYNAKSRLDTGNLAKYNFFTSRYFSALDIIVDYKPDVILITDVVIALQSRLDPWTDVIQVAGRYRHGINSLTHISNFKPGIVARTGETGLTYLHDCFAIYDGMVESYRGTKSEGRRDALKQAMEALWVKKFYLDEKVSNFMIDNFLYDERVKEYYKEIENLLAAYKARPKHFVTSHLEENYAVGDFGRLRRNTLKGKALYKEIAEQIYSLTSGGKHYMVIDGEDELKHVRQKHPLIATAYDLMGWEGLEGTGYVTSKIKKAITIAEKNKQDKLMAEAVYQVFKVGEYYTDAEIKTKLQGVFTRYKEKKPATPSSIRRFFETQKTTRDGKHVHILKRRLY